MGHKRDISKSSRQIGEPKISTHSGTNCTVTTTVRMVEQTETITQHLCPICQQVRCDNAGGGCYNPN